MTQQYTPNLGQLPADDARRDAVHIAVAPVVAGQTLFAGQRVRLTTKGIAFVSNGDDAIGIVDPFLTIAIAPGDRFWLFLFPNTVTSLRHVWTHPGFRAQAPEAS